jgi:hypothetical protein
MVNRTFDRLVHFDERSKFFPVEKEDLLRSKTRKWRVARSKEWDIKAPFVIDQGAEGACVGFAVTNELQAPPAKSTFGSKFDTERFAKEKIYWEAQKIDPWPGGSYPGSEFFYEGTSLLAGIKVAKNLGFFEEYRWSFSIEDLVLGLSWLGPAVLGLDWYSGMNQPDRDGFIYVSGWKQGGHAILAKGVKIHWKPKPLSSVWHRTFKDVDLDKSFLILRNSWGETWGDKGNCYFPLSHAQWLLSQQGEAAFFVNRKRN